MAFVVQGVGSATPLANAYMTVAEFKAYHADRGNEAAAEASDQEAEYAIVKATDYIDMTWDFQGVASFDGQTLEWPRAGVYTKDLEAVDDQGVPEFVKRACAELAIAALSYDLDPNAPGSDGQLVTGTSQRAGDLAISTSFSGELRVGSPVWKRANKILAPYLASPELLRA